MPNFSASASARPRCRFPDPFWVDETNDRVKSWFVINATHFNECQDMNTVGGIRSRRPCSSQLMADLTARLFYLWYFVKTHSLIRSLLSFPLERNKVFVLIVLAFWRLKKRGVAIYLRRREKFDVISRGERLFDTVQYQSGHFTLEAKSRYLCCIGTNRKYWVILKDLHGWNVRMRQKNTGW